MSCPASLPEQMSTSHQGNMAFVCHNGSVTRIGGAGLRLTASYAKDLSARGKSTSFPLYLNNHYFSLDIAM